MSAIRSAAAREEEAELEYLRAQADGSAAEAAATLAELGGRLTAATRPAAMARRITADARVATVCALRGVPGRIAGQRGNWRRPVLAAVPVLAVAAALAYAAARFNATRRG
jgi:hypothetical protein